MHRNTLIACNALATQLSRFHMKRSLTSLKTLLTIFASTLSMLFAAPQAFAEQSCPARVLMTPIYWDIDRLASVRSQLAGGGSEYDEAYRALVRDADKALIQSPYSVTHKERAGGLKI